MTYDNVYRIFTDSDAELRARYAHITGDLEAMRELALILRGRRERRGAVDFAFKEARIALDENGAPISVEAAEQTVANRIIEEFMIVCNETVAERFGGDGQPFVFRTHDKPDPFKLEAFSVFAAELGFPLRAGADARGPVAPGDLQAVVSASEDTPYQKAIAAVMLRAMAKAGYTAGNIGHFGLASECYCHFTSPIRRYPDLLVHRIIKATFRHKTTAQATPAGLPRAERERYKTLLPGICEHCSERERAADDVEYETDALKKAEYMKAFVGQSFDGTVSGVTAFGVFVELDNTVEGLMRLGDLYDDYYIYDEARHTVVGKNTGRRYAIGDHVAVDLVRVSVEARQIDFMPSDIARKAAASMSMPFSDKKRSLQKNGGRGAAKTTKSTKSHSAVKTARPGNSAKPGKAGKKRHGGPRTKRGRR